MLASLAQREAAAHHQAAQQLRARLPAQGVQPAKPMTVFSSADDAQALKQTWKSQPGTEAEAPFIPAVDRPPTIFDRHPLDLQMFASDEVAAVGKSKGPALDLTTRTRGAPLTNTEAAKNAASYSRVFNTPAQASEAVRQHSSNITNTKIDVMRNAKNYSPERVVATINDVFARRDALLGAAMAKGEGAANATVAANASCNEILNEFRRLGRIRY